MLLLLVFIYLIMEFPNSDVTLNALNAGREGDSDVDLVGISDVNKTLEDHLSTDLL